ncbi:hypothetical protein ABW20_dc0106232 [Dactylellina cionopaga]|nr:hypothetical protein ABW20_dc0106232 [Dactylellina cionopaga]
MRQLSQLGVFAVITLFNLPCHAFYRLWGYNDLARNLADPSLFKAKSSILTRGGRIHQRSLCESFPDPEHSPLGILRVAGFMSHPQLNNPIQAIGFWREPDFNCGSVPPAVIIYLQPGTTTQIIDLRAFGVESVYSNWRQLIPQDAYWREFIEPELAQNGALGQGFVMKINRNTEDHNLIQSKDIVWNTQGPPAAWILDNRAAILGRDASKTGFESRFKNELQTWEQKDITDPLPPEETQRLNAELAAMKEAMVRQHSLWDVNINRAGKGLEPSKQYEGPIDVGTGADMNLMRGYVMPFGFPQNFANLKGLLGSAEDNLISGQFNDQQNGNIDTKKEEGGIQVKKADEITARVEQDGDDSVIEVIKTENNEEDGGDNIQLTKAEDTIANVKQDDSDSVIEVIETENTQREEVGEAQKTEQPNLGNRNSLTISDPIFNYFQPFNPMADTLLSNEATGITNNDLPVGNILDRWPLWYRRMMMQQQQQMQIPPTSSGSHGYLQNTVFGYPSYGQSLNYPANLLMEYMQPADHDVAEIPRIHSQEKPNLLPIEPSTNEDVTLNNKRPLPAMSEVFEDVVATNLRKGHFPNKSPTNPSWKEVAQKTKETDSEYKENQKWVQDLVQRFPIVKKPQPPKSKDTTPQ